MRREFRGRNYRVEYNLPILQISEVINKKRSNPDIVFEGGELTFWKNMKLNEALGSLSLSDEKVVVNAIRRTILQQYNGNITDEILIHYLYLKKYIKYLKRQTKSGSDEERSIQHAIIDDMRKYGDKEWVEKNGIVLHQNCLFLNWISSDELNVDNSYICSWMHYPVERTFIDTIDEMKGDKNPSSYSELKQKEYELFTDLKLGNLHLGEIRNIVISKDGKEREVCIADSQTDRLLINYLAKRMRKVFQISFPDRDKIMEIVINLVDSLPNLQDYTIYRFDFKDFFKSVSAKKIFYQYIMESDMARYEKVLLLELIEKTILFGCAQGLPTSNVMIEIIANVFDRAVQTAFDKDGLILYKRYVDDGILIFNRRVNISAIREVLQTKIKLIFNCDGQKDSEEKTHQMVMLSLTKEKYQTRYTGTLEFDYLGYAFLLERKADKLFYRYGIAKRKIEKYEKQLQSIYHNYAKSKNSRWLYHRLRFYNSRIVFYDYSIYKYKRWKKWDVRGLVNNYRMLRKYILSDSDSNRIIDETEDFLKKYHNELLRCMYIEYRFAIPDFLKGKGIENYSLWTAFERNHSIVFQANIGWDIQYLQNAIKDITGRVCRGSYTDLVKEYSKLVFLDK